MTISFKPLLLAALLAGASISANAQGMGMGGQHAGPTGQHQRMDPAKMQEMMAKRQAELKTRLNISAAQEGAWNAFIASMQPPAGRGPANRQQMHEEMAKLSTPERIDRMNAMKAERDARMAQRQEATKALYAALTPEQQKVFDANALRRGHGRHANMAAQKG